MLVYHSTTESGLPRKPVCRAGMCRVRGVPVQHLCFASEPLSGHGPNVLVVDIPEDELVGYEYEYEFHRGARMFAIPLPVLTAATVKVEEFATLTGRPWNRWIVPLLDSRPQPRNPRFQGSWALVWTSGAGKVGAKIRRRIQGQYLSVELTASDDYDPIRDYVIAEIHEEQLSDTVRGVKETWHYSHLGGALPYWMVFPVMWQAWVWNEAVLSSALNYLSTLFPSLRGLINAAATKESKHNRSRAWRLVADELNRALTKRLHRPITLGKLAGHSWTAVAAMPLRIALRVSQNLPDTPWEPPVPKPEFQHPDEAGRYLLANLYGIHPTEGPGVDHSPQDRPYAKLEGELTEHPSDE